MACIHLRHCGGSARDPSLAADPGDRSLVLALVVDVPREGVNRRSTHNVRGDQDLCIVVFGAIGLSAGSVPAIWPIGLRAARVRVGRPLRGAAQLRPGAMSLSIPTRRCSPSCASASKTRAGRATLRERTNVEPALAHVGHWQGRRPATAAPARTCSTYAALPWSQPPRHRSPAHHRRLPAGCLTTT